MSSAIPWSYAARDFCKDLPFFGSMGLSCGFVQWVGFLYFDGNDVGARLLQEHIALQSLWMTVILLWITKGITERLLRTRKLPKLLSVIAHIECRAVAFASVGASVLLGFGLAVGISGAWAYALMVLIFATYFVALAEVSANPFYGPKHSRMYPLAIGAIIGIPAGISLVV